MGEGGAGGPTGLFVPAAPPGAATWGSGRVVDRLSSLLEERTRDDAFGRAVGFSLSDVVRWVADDEDLHPNQFVQYSAVISSGLVWRECLVAGAMMLAGFHHF